MSKRARGQLYVDKDVQRALLFQLFRHWTLFVAVLTGMLLMLEALSAGPQPSLAAYFQATWRHYSPLFIVVATLFPVFAYDSIKLSHRFVGPIVRLRRAMRQAALGERVEPVQFRKSDFWQDMAPTFNALLERLPEDADGTGDSTAVGQRGPAHSGAAANAKEA
jgi:hypothetical protein